MGWPGVGVSVSDDKGPTWRRPRDRDVYVSKETPRSGVPAFVTEECTGRYEGVELQRVRERRPTPERISRLEAKHDKLDDKVDAIDVKVSKIDGKLDTLVSLAENRAKSWPPIIKAVGAALALIIAAVLGRSAL